MKLPRENLLNPARVALSIRQRFNPIRDISADKLTAAHDAFDRGQLREAAQMWDAIEDRDDLIKAVAAKRKKNIARNGFEIITLVKEGDPTYKQSLAQKEALQYFYDQLTVTSALDENEHGNFKLLVRQMMDAVGKRFAVHEIVWQPQALGSARAPRASAGASPDESPSSKNSGLRTQHSGLQFGLTAELRFVPLWFFENTIGRLRFLTNPYAPEGVDLKPGAWLITVADGIMKACANAWLLKNLALGDWSDYSGNYGKPGIIASTTAARGSNAFDDMEEALENFLATKAIVTNTAEGIKVIDLASANPPFEPLVERMDRLISALWRGSDLSTISKAQGYGASLQQGETQILEEDDAELITETLRAQIDRIVLQWHFGPDVQILAGVSVQQTPRRGTQQDMIIDQFLLNAGMKLSIADAAKRYGRALADPGEPLLVPLATTPSLNNPTAEPLEETFTTATNKPTRENVSDGI